MLTCATTWYKCFATTLADSAGNSDIPSCLSSLADKLKLIGTFYDSIGGIIGYQLKSLELIAAGMEDLRVQQVRSGATPWDESTCCGAVQACSACSGVAAVAPPLC